MELQQEYSIALFSIKSITKSVNKLYKYTITLESMDEEITINFGSCQRQGLPYEHYKDRTGLSLYTDYDNYNPIKSRAWYLKYKHKINKQFYSSKMLEYTFLQKM